MNENELKKSERQASIIEKDLDDIVRKDDIILSILISLFGFANVLFFYVHQDRSTGFFTSSFGTFEMILLYGSLSYWIVTCLFLLFGLKNPSRDLDSFGGLFFAALGFAWFSVVFPFEFSHLADVVPDSLKFLFEWISNSVARVLMVLASITHILLGRYALIIRLKVLKERKRRKKLQIE